MQDWADIVINMTDFSVISDTNFEDFSATWGIRYINYGDVDNDGENEICISNPENFAIINEITMEMEFHMEMDAGEFAIGDVDNDTITEIVFSHGLIWSINSGGSVEVENNLLPDQDYPNKKIELSDIDFDGLPEAIIGGYNGVQVFDIDVSSLKYEIEVFAGIETLMMYDIDSDGTEEIIFSPTTSDDIMAYNAVTGVGIWEIINPDSGVGGVVIEDFDNDGSKELVFGAGCGSTGPDHIFFHNLSNQQLEWQSDQSDGFYQAIEVIDIDEDGEYEIISMSRTSESSSYAGILTIYDAITKEIEFESDPYFFESLEETTSFSIHDYGNDGDLDLVLSGGIWNGGKIWVLDGNTYTLEYESPNTSPNDLVSFNRLTVVDLDNDGVLEYIGSRNSAVYILNSQDLSVETQIGPYNYFYPKYVMAGNVDEDTNLEIVVGSGYLWSLDDNSFTLTQSENDEYRAWTLYDWDYNGTMEIVAGDDHGNIHVLNGSTLEIIEVFTLELGEINSLTVGDVNGSGQEEIVFTTTNTLYYLSKNGELIQSQNITRGLGSGNALEIVDFDQDGMANIVLGTEHSILEIDPLCAECASYEVNFEGIDANCGFDNGAVVGNSSDITTKLMKFLP